MAKKEKNNSGQNTNKFSVLAALPEVVEPEDVETKDIIPKDVKPKKAKPKNVKPEKDTTPTAPAPSNEPVEEKPKQDTNWIARLWRAITTSPQSPKAVEEKPEEDAIIPQNDTTTTTPTRYRVPIKDRPTEGFDLEFLLSDKYQLEEAKKSYLVRKTQPVLDLIKYMDTGEDITIHLVLSALGTAYLIKDNWPWLMVEMRAHKNLTLVVSLLIAGASTLHITSIWDWTELKNAIEKRKTNSKGWDKLTDDEKVQIVTALHSVCTMKFIGRPEKQTYAEFAAPWKKSKHIDSALWLNLLWWVNSTKKRRDALYIELVCWGFTFWCLFMMFFDDRVYDSQSWRASTGRMVDG
ncbi:hypothetical protein QBC38DRAFT_447177 [Podospora fimiseda]|uniref:Uncharacterized protein n=1 Tax=Podospora fimiseda TaxID=252190 RepID=A0AAN7GVC1_9PEZI|nr:hypothetical protein QBC38DRAFT_447177 [Podospora fimiseda]